MSGRNILMMIGEVGGSSGDGLVYFKAYSSIK